MSLLRRLGLLAAVVTGFAVLTSPASAAFSRDNSLPFHLDSVNFRVHYQSDINPADNPPLSAITQTQAGDIAALAERALAAETADGYPRPLSDGVLGGDGKIDIYVEDFSASPGTLADTAWDTDALQSSGFIELAGNVPDEAFTQHVLAHELFHLVQFAMWLPPSLWSGSPSLTDAWILEATAEWMGFRVDGYSLPTGLGPPDMSLDCRDPLGTNMCDLTDDYLNNGYSRWPFFEYVNEKYGTTFVKDTFAQGFAGAPSAIAALAAALVAKGTTLTDAYNAWAFAELTSAYSVLSLQGVSPQPYGGQTFTGVTSGPVLTAKVAVNHRSTRFLEFDKGKAVGGSAAAPCWKATLSLTVTIPSGTSAKPAFYWNGPGSAGIPLAISGNTGTAQIPWDTCTWVSNVGYLALPNPSQNIDAADFKVVATIDVDGTTQVTSILPATPPPPQPVTGPVIPVSSVDTAPAISVFGPQALTLSPTATQIRLIVDASGQGLVTATLGSLKLGTVSLRAGNNDVRFTIPKGALATLRRSASASNVLTLTPTSLSGAATGQAIVRKISVTGSKPVAKAKLKTVKKAPAKKTVPKKTTKRK